MDVGCGGFPLFSPGYCQSHFVLVALYTLGECTFCIKKHIKKSPVVCVVNKRESGLFVVQNRKEGRFSEAAAGLGK